jgi:hypothetical protein
VNRITPISRRVWFAFGSSAVVFGVVAWLAHRTVPTPAGHAAEFATLTRERDSLRGHDDDVRDRLRGQQQGLARLAWTPEKLAELERRQGDRWRWTWEPGDPPTRVTLQRVAPQIEEWAAYRAFVAAWAGQPGVIVESLEILADGPARARRLTRVALGLRFVVAVTPSRDGPRAAPSRGPPTVAPAVGPATPRKVVPFTPLRRPSASAEPPAPGTSGASFRSRPSGVQGRSR